jgi:hypothetical protein
MVQPPVPKSTGGLSLLNAEGNREQLAIEKESARNLGAEKSNL